MFLPVVNLDSYLSSSFPKESQTTFVRVLNFGWALNKGKGNGKFPNWDEQIISMAKIEGFIYSILLATISGL